MYLPCLGRNITFVSNFFFFPRTIDFTMLSLTALQSKRKHQKTFAEENVSISIVDSVFYIVEK